MHPIQAAIVSARNEEILKGQKAWTQIKATTQEHGARFDVTSPEYSGVVKLVGDALWAGRSMHQNDRKFGEWCVEAGFADLEHSDRRGAMWIATTAQWLAS